MRVDGVLHSLAACAGTRRPITARLKVLSNLDIAEHRVPQDGQFTSRSQTARSRFDRHASLPRRGKIVLRLLHQVEQRWTSKRWGYRLSSLPPRSALNQPQGLMLVTGPTGSGKTVTCTARCRRGIATRSYMQR
ncbi:MAG: ATPase, T2SS/T4P/T4SS family [Enterobacteriaceae bacterium]